MLVRHGFSGNQRTVVVLSFCFSAFAAGVFLVGQLDLLADFGE
ncbi:hypothetical protein ABZV91_07920 [Nocardia sp. NPDC004568]